jgi:hypothetical protein
MTLEAQRSTGTAPRVEGEHVHHHGMIKVLSPRLPTVFGSPSIVHESVQPVVHKGDHPARDSANHGPYP